MPGGVWMRVDEAFVMQYPLEMQHLLSIGAVSYPLLSTDFLKDHDWPSLRCDIVSAVFCLP